MSARCGTRLDVALVAAGLAPTREKAQALILAGRVRVDGERRDKAGAAVPPGARIELDPGDRPFASRGGQKLAGALDALGLDPAGRRCLDVGASTGGFTDVLLRRGAVHVTALDVGRGERRDHLERDSGPSSRGGHRSRAGPRSKNERETSDGGLGRDDVRS